MNCTITFVNLSIILHVSKDIVFFAGNMELLTIRCFYKKEKYNS